MSKDGIRLYPLKVEAIINLPSPSLLHQLQSLQGKVNFLCRCIPNYAEVAKGYTRLLKQGVPLCWDEIAQKSFEALKTLLVNAPLLLPPNYHRVFSLYLVVAFSTISMVLVQDDDDGKKHVIYYLSHNLLNPEMHYAHVENLALAAVQEVQCFLHYILLRTTTVISACNPMTYILSRQLMGGDTRSGLPSSKSLIWNLLFPSRRNH